MQLWHHLRPLSINSFWKKATCKTSDMSECVVVHVRLLSLLVFFTGFIEQQVLPWANPSPNALTGGQIIAKVPPSCCQSRRYSHLLSPEWKGIAHAQMQMRFARGKRLQKKS